MIKIASGKAVATYGMVRLMRGAEARQVRQSFRHFRPGFRKGDNNEIV
jgi:alkylated DNA nucleotide flippase Atl1